MRYKIVFTTLKEDSNAIREALGRVGAGTIGEYQYCSFTVTGTGRFKPTENAEPLIGEGGKLEAVEEERIEINCDHNNMRAALDAIRSMHPYEEPAIDIYQLVDETEFKG